MNTTNNEPELYAGTPQSATSTSMTLAKDASDIDGAYIMHALRIIEGAGCGEQQTIKSYDGRTKIATLHGTWTTIPDATSVYAIITPEPTGLSAPMNIKVDENLKTEFNSLMGFHFLTLSDALEAGMKEIIRKVRSPEEIKWKINEKESEISSLHAELSNAIAAQRELKDTKSDFRWD